MSDRESLARAIHEEDCGCSRGPDTEHYSVADIILRSDWLERTRRAAAAEALEALAEELSSDERIFLTRNGITSMPLNTQGGAAHVARARARELGVDSTVE